MNFGRQKKGARGLINVVSEAPALLLLLQTSVLSPSVNQIRYVDSTLTPPGEFPQTNEHLAPAPFSNESIFIEKLCFYPIHCVSLHSSVARALVL